MNRIYSILGLIAIASLLSSVCLAAGLTADMMSEGESKTIKTQDGNYRLKVVAVSATTLQTLMQLNGENSRFLRNGERYRFSDGSILTIRNIIPQSGSSLTSGDLVEFYFMPGGAPILDQRTGTMSYALAQDTEYDLGSIIDSAFESASAPSVSSANPLIVSRQTPYLVGVPAPKPTTPVSPSPAPASTTQPTTASNQCNSDEDCDDNDGCTTDVCLGSPRRCQHKSSNPGCSFGKGLCVPYYRTMVISSDEIVYCSQDGSWKDQKSDDKDCLGDYECRSGICKDKRCSGSSAPTIESPAPNKVVTVPDTWFTTIVKFFVKVMGFGA